MNKKLVITLISFLAAILLVFVFIEPLWNSVKGLRSDIAGQNQEIEKIEELLVKVNKLEQEYQELNDDAEKISLALPKEKDLAYLLTQFETLASSNGLLLESISLEEQDVSQDIRQPPLGSSSQGSSKIEALINAPSLSLQVRLSGSYESFKGYLSFLEDNVRLMDVQSIGFTSQGDKKGSELADLGIFDFDLAVAVYLQE